MDVSSCTPFPPSVPSLSESTQPRRTGRKRKQAQPVLVKSNASGRSPPHVLGALHQTVQYLIFSWLDFSETAALSQVDRCMRLSVGDMPIYHITLANSGLTYRHPNVVCAAHRVHLAITANHRLCMSSLAEVLCRQPIYGATRAYVQSLVQRSVDTDPAVNLIEDPDYDPEYDPDYQIIRNNRTKIIESSYLEGQLSMVSDKTLWEEYADSFRDGSLATDLALEFTKRLNQVTVYGFCTAEQAQMIIDFIKPILTSNPDRVYYKVLHDLLSYLFANDLNEKEAAWIQFQATFKLDEAKHEIEHLELTAFVELLVSQRQLAVEDANVRQSSMRDLFHLSENTRNSYYVRALASITVAHHQLKHPTPGFTDAMVYNALRPLHAQQFRLRFRVQYTASLLLASFQIAGRLPGAQYSDLEIMLIGRTALWMQETPSREHGLVVDPLLPLEILMHLQLKRQGGLTVGKAHEQATRLVENATRYSASEARVHLYAKALIGYGMSPDKERDIEEIKSLVKLLNEETDIKARSKIQVLIARMYMDDRGVSVMDDQLPVKYAQEVQRNSKPSSRRYMEASLVLGQWYLNSLTSLDLIFHTVSKAFVSNTIQSLTEIYAPASKASTQLKIQAKLCLAEIGAITETEWPAWRSLLQEVYEDPQADEQMKQKATQIFFPGTR